MGKIDTAAVPMDVPAKRLSMCMHVPPTLNQRPRGLASVILPEHFVLVFVRQVQTR